MENNKIISFHRKKKYEFLFTIDISISKCDNNTYTIDCIYPQEVTQEKITEVLKKTISLHKEMIKIPIRDLIGKRFSISYYEKNTKDFKIVYSPKINDKFIIAMITLVLNDFGLKIGKISSAK